MIYVINHNKYEQPWCNPLPRLQKYLSSVKPCRFLFILSFFAHLSDPLRTIATCNSSLYDSAFALDSTFIWVNPFLYHHSDYDFVIKPVIDAQHLYESPFAPNSCEFMAIYFVKHYRKGNVLLPNVVFGVWLEDFDAIGISLDIVLSWQATWYQVFCRSRELTE